MIAYRRLLAFPGLTLGLLLTLFLRLPSLFDPYWYVDEGVYLTGGHLLRRGLTLYRDLYDNKPPLIHYVAALTPTQFWFHLLGIVLSALTLYFFVRLASLLLGKSKWVSLLTILFALIWNLPYLEGHTVNAEHFFVPLGLAAFWLALGRDRPERLRLWGSGFLLGLGFLFKFHAVFDLAALTVFWMLILDWSGKKELARRFFFLLSGFCLPFLFSLIYFAWRGVLTEYWQAAFLDNFDYAGRWRPAVSGFWAVWGPANMRGRLLLLGFFSSLLFLGRKKIARPFLFLSLWCLFTLFGALLSGRNYPHYLLPVVPPLLLALPLLIKGRWRERGLAGAVCVLTLGAVLFFRFYFYPAFNYYSNFGKWMSGRTNWLAAAQNNFGGTISRNLAVARYVQENTASDARVFLWTDQPHLYALLERTPAVPYLFIFQIQDLRKEEEVLARLRQASPQLVVTFAEEARLLPGLPELLVEDYRWAATIQGADIYIRRF